MRTKIVDFNNEGYNISTGHIISTINSSTNKSRQILDGFVQATVKPTTAKISSKTNLNPHRQTKSNDLHKRTDKAHTLMRSGLKKPADRFQSNLKRFSQSGGVERELRAKLTSKHNRIDRFGSLKSGTSRAGQSPAATVKKLLSGEVISSGYRAGKSSSAAPTAAPLPSMVTSASHQKLERLLDEALHKADAHKNALRYHAAKHFWQRRWFSGPRKWLSITAVFVLVAGVSFLAWHKVPQVSVRVASMRAHINASIPSYKPEGYSLAGPAKAVLGSVTVKYVHGEDQTQTYDITQTKSQLTNSMVSQNIVPKGATVQTSQVAGNTVYIYGPDNDAAWVNNGVLYTIKDRASLRSDQLIKIVQGLNP